MLRLSNKAPRILGIMLLFFQQSPAWGQLNVDNSPSACWKQKQFFETKPMANDGPRVTCGLIQDGSATSRADATPHTSNGLCQAHDSCSGAQVGSSATAVGSLIECWSYCGSLVGHLEGNVNLHANGTARVEKGQAAAAAVGYAEYQSTTTKAVAVYLDQSAGETKRGVLGSLTLDLQLSEITVPVSQGLNIAEHPDSSLVCLDEYLCTNLFVREQRTKSIVTCWANGSPVGTSRASGNMQARIEGSIILSELEPEDCPDV